MTRSTLNGVTGALGALLAILAFAGSAQAAGPVWELNSHHSPTNFQAGKPAEYSFDLANIGDAAASGPPTVTVKLPAGVTARLTQGSPYVPPAPAFATRFFLWNGDDGLGGYLPCQGSAGAATASCQFLGSGAPASGGTYPGRVTVFVDVDPSATGPLTAEATVTGGAETVTVSETATLSPDPAFGIVPGTLEADAFGRDAQPVRQAGAHPLRAMARFDLNQKMSIQGNLAGGGLGPWPEPIGTLRNIDVTLPRGFVGNPLAADRCTSVEFAETSDVGSNCPVNSQVGVIKPTIRPTSGVGTAATFFKAPLYNMVVPKGALAHFAFQVQAREVHILASLDPKDNSIVTKVHDAPEQYAVYDQALELWGVPADPIHDGDRFDFLKAGRNNGDGWGARYSGRTVPFLTLPSECGVDDTTDITRLASWQNPSLNVADPAISSAPVQVSGCDRLSFNPSISLQPETTTPDSPTGLAVDIELPQSENSVGLGTPPLRNAKVVLPDGMTINPAAADGLQACSDDQLRLGTNLGLKAGEPACPAGSKIGTVTAKSPALEDPIEGDVYIRSQNSDDPQSGEMFRMAIVLKNEDRGLIVKLPGSVTADPQTGRLVTRFNDNPQLPVEKISLRLKGGQRAPLATPATCGEKTFTATLSSWGGQVSEQSDSFTIPCPASNTLSPSFKAGSTDPRAGVFSPFVVNIARPDGQAYINGLSMNLAPGMLAKLKGLPVCSDAAASAGSCAGSSRVGTATVGAGSGAPFYLKGGVYLTGPYKGAPYGLAVKVRAAAGPFDLGDVIVRQALHVDRTDGHVTVVSDPLPTIVKGVPVRLRSVDVDNDRPGFTSTPTSCAAKEVVSQLSSPDGQTVSLRSPYRVGDCGRLDLKPNLALTLSGKGQTTDGKHPAVTANVTQPVGQSNLKKVRVALPLSLALDPDNANGLCEFVDGSKPDPTCPKASIVGTATAVTPILDEPLTGPVYFVKNIRKDPKSGREIRTLPKLVIPLTGQNGLRLNLTGTSAVEDEQLVTTFDNIPDAPVSSFKLSIIGGKGGILTVSGADICKATQIADQQIDGQNAKQADTSISIQTPDCPLKVLSKKIGKTSVAVKVGGLGAGKVTVSGKGIKKTTKTITKSTVATITARRARGRLGKVKVSYLPAGAKKAKTASATLR